jgi:hypothetical protein
VPRVPARCRGRQIGPRGVIAGKAKRRRKDGDHRPIIEGGFVDPHPGTEPVPRAIPERHPAFVHPQAGSLARDQYPWLATEPNYRPRVVRRRRRPEPLGADIASAYARLEIRAGMLIVHGRAIPLPRVFFCRVGRRPQLARGYPARQRVAIRRVVSLATSASLPKIRGHQAGELRQTGLAISAGVSDACGVTERERWTNGDNRLRAVYDNGTESYVLTAR